MGYCSVDGCAMAQRPRGAGYRQALVPSASQGVSCGRCMSKEMLMILMMVMLMATITISITVSITIKIGVAVTSD